MGRPFYRPIPNPRVSEGQPPTSGYYSGVWYGTLPLPERRMDFYGGTEPIMPCSKSATRRPTHPPGSLSFGSFLPVVPATRFRTQTCPRPAGRGTNHPPAIPKMLFPLPKPGWDWTVLDNVHSTSGPLRTSCSILHRVVGYICATHCTVLYVLYCTLTYVDAWSGVVPVSQSTILVVDAQKKHSKESTVSCIQHTKTGLEHAGMMLPDKDNHWCCSTAGRE